MSPTFFPMLCVAPREYILFTRGKMAPMERVGTIISEEARRNSTRRKSQNLSANSSLRLKKINGSSLYRKIEAIAKKPITASRTENQRTGLLSLSTNGAKAIEPSPMPARNVASIIVKAYTVDPNTRESTRVHKTSYARLQKPDMVKAEISIRFNLLRLPAPSNDRGAGTSTSSCSWTAAGPLLNR